jgi:hypothetical protein
MRILRDAAAAAVLTFAGSGAQAASITPIVFATGSAIGATSPDSVAFGDGSVWISYQNGADSAGGGGSSTVARYTPTGALLNTFSITGNVDGLRVDPATGLVWALQNNDGNSALTTINPLTNALTPYTYGSSYTNVANRGFDDVVFRNGQVFLSETNPTGTGDPVIVQLTTGLVSPLQVSPVLNSGMVGTNLATGQTNAPTTITDSDSLILTPSGDLALTGEADKQIVFVHNPGAGNQSISFISLLGTNNQPITGSPDDTIYPTATQGLIYLADTGANTVYELVASGLSPGSVLVDVGNELGSLDTATGVVTPLFTGVSPHGAVFVTFAETVPEPNTAYGIILGGLSFGGIIYRRRRKLLRNPVVTTNLGSSITA